VRCHAAGWPVALRRSGDTTGQPRNYLDNVGRQIQRSDTLLIVGLGILVLNLDAAREVLGVARRELSGATEHS
jgi:hypothetical protein